MYRIFLLIAGVSLVSIIFILWVADALIKIRAQPVVSGSEEMIGAVGECLTNAFAEFAQSEIGREVINCDNDRPDRFLKPVRSKIHDDFVIINYN